MADLARKKSPRAPSIALDEALDRSMRAYDKERLHPAPTDVVAKNIGYKGASSGSALAALASLRYYGLLERPREGMLAVTKDVEALKFAPSEEIRRSLLLNFLRRPPLFAELLEKYSTGLPSDANLKFDLIQRGFLPATAASFVAIFRRSVEHVRFFDSPEDAALVHGPMLEEDGQYPSDEPLAPQIPEGRETAKSRPSPARGPVSPSLSVDEVEHDRIPVRLTGGRRAWLLIPMPFYAADKQRLKAQIDLLLAQDEENAVA